VELDKSNGKDAIKRFFILTLFISIISCASLQKTQYFDRGKDRLNAKNWDGAIANFDKCLEIDPYNKKLYNYRGIAKSDKQDFDGAIADYTKAIEINPNYAIAYSNRAWARYNKKDFDNAINDYTKAIEIDPNYTRAYSARGYVKMERKDFNSAITDFTTAIDQFKNKNSGIDPLYSITYTFRGWAKNRKYDLDGALADYDKAIELNPKDGETYRMKAWFLATCPEDKYRSGSKAIDLAKKAVDIEKNFENLDTLAAAYAESGMFQEAIKTQNEAIEFSTKDPQAKDSMNDLRKHLKSYKNKMPWRD